MNENLTFSLASARKNAHLTQAEFAEKMGVSVFTVSMWENGKTEPRLSQAREISKLVGIPLDNISFCP